MTEYNEEDLRDHRTVALAVHVGGQAECLPMEKRKFLFSINLKNNMITFPIGKAANGEFLIHELVREMNEEIGVNLDGVQMYLKKILQFTKQYERCGKSVNVETNVYAFTDEVVCGPWVCETAFNNEPEKCGGIFLATVGEAKRMADRFGLELADCVQAFPWSVTSFVAI